MLGDHSPELSQMLGPVTQKQNNSSHPAESIKVLLPSSIP